MATALTELLQILKGISFRPHEEITHCPNCGWNLQRHPITGEKHCPLGDWQEGLGEHRD